MSKEKDQTEKLKAKEPPAAKAENSVPKAEPSSGKAETSSPQTEKAKAQPDGGDTKPKSSAEAQSEKSAAEAKAEKPAAPAKSKNGVQLGGLFAFKKAMSHIYDEKHKMIPVTVLKYEPLKITQIKTKEKDGVDSVQAALPSSKKTNKALKSHFKKAGFKNGALFTREIKGKAPEGAALGQEISIESLKKGDIVQLSGFSKGHGFSGVLKRWGFGGGPASHGAEKHRTTGSVANTATQGRVFPGKKMPGHFGFKKTTIKNGRIMDVIPDKGAILVKGSLPGAFNTLISIQKQRASK